MYYAYYSDVFLPCSSFRSYLRLKVKIGMGGGTPFLTASVVVGGMVSRFHRSVELFPGVTFSSAFISMDFSLRGSACIFPDSFEEGAWPWFKETQSP